MKKTLLTCLGSLFIMHATIAQTNQIQNTGNVGIGTLNPAYPLDVVGSARISGNIYFNASQYMTASPGTGFWDFNNGSGNGWAFRWIQNGYTGLYLTPLNNFLIGGVTDQGFKLDVNGTVRFNNAFRLSGLGSDNTKNRILSADAAGNLFFRDASTLGGGNGWSLGGNTSVNPSTAFVGTTDNSPVAFRTGNVERLRVDGTTGYVGIGTSAPQSLLAVKGTVTAQKVVVTQLNWADYVFEPSYKLPALADVAEYIRVNRHLPEMPTTAEVAEHGIELGSNQAALLKKIEELTLYIIDQQKQIVALQEKQEEVKSLREQIAELKNMIQK